MKTQYYFKDNNSEICYNKQYFNNYMKQNKLNKIEVYEAVLDKVDGIFWCKKHEFCSHKDFSSCGNQCKEYSPRNGRSGRCIHHSVQLYEHDNKVILTLT